MNRFLYSGKLLYILAALLLLTFFLPDIIGPVPAIILGGMVVGVALFVYNRWSQIPSDKPDPANEEKRPPESD